MARSGAERDLSIYKGMNEVFDRREIAKYKYPKSIIACLWLSTHTYLPERRYLMMPTRTPMLCWTKCQLDHLAINGIGRGCVMRTATNSNTGSIRNDVACLTLCFHWQMISFILCTESTTLCMHNQARRVTQKSPRWWFVAHHPSHPRPSSPPTSAF